MGKLSMRVEEAIAEMERVVRFLFHLCLPRSPSSAVMSESGCPCFRTTDLTARSSETFHGHRVHGFYEEQAQWHRTGERTESG